MTSIRKKQFRIIIMDNEPSLLTGISMLLESLGHYVRQASGGEAALQCIRQGEYFDRVNA